MVISHLDMSICDVNSEFFGISRLMLMENAGASVARAVQGLMTESTSGVIVCCGTGGNGGDGFVAARHLARYISTKVLLLGQPSQIKSKEALYNWEVLKKLHMSIERVIIKDTREIPDRLFDQTKIIIDALLGTGIRGKIREPTSSCIDLINSTRKRGAIVLSVDVPSGLGTSGKVEDKSVIPEYNLSFHAAKAGIDSFTLKNTVVNIGIPPEAEVIAGPGDIISLKKKREWSKKGDSGKILIVGGSDHYSGAPTLAALAALRSGADLVTVLAPASISNVIRSFSPDIIVRSYPSDFLTVEEAAIVEKMADRFDTLLIGPGLATEQGTDRAVQAILSSPTLTGKNIVIDADGLKMITPGVLTQKTVLTPHSGEFKIISGMELPVETENMSERIKMVQEVASKIPATLLVKGHHDVICCGNRWKINKTGDPWMTTGGTGDVLAGITAAMCGLCPTVYRAAVASAFTCGLAGMITKYMALPETPQSLIDCIPVAINESRKFISGDPNLIVDIFDL
ncbi:MAG: NAD(P)H-hydrate dehydratase [Candidatus Hodarchaeales archaeon]